MIKVKYAITPVSLAILTVDLEKAGLSNTLITTFTNKRNYPIS
jgi:hypothetical protein